MAVVAHQEESPADDVLIWRYAASRAHQAAEEARARAQEATAAVERADRRILKAIAPHFQRAIRGVRPPRRAPGKSAAAPSAPQLSDLGNSSPRVWTPTVWAPVLERRSDVLWAEEPVWAPKSHASWSASFDDILLDAASVPLPAALLVYDDVLEWLQRLHGQGLTHSKVRASLVEVDQEGRCTIRASELEPVAGAGVRPRLEDLQAATWIFVQAAGGARVSKGAVSIDPSLLEALPLPARCLVAQTLAVEAAYRLTAAKLRADLAVAARAFLQEDWEVAARAWLASAAAASGVELTASRQDVDAPDAAPGQLDHADPKRPVLFGAITRREPRFMVGLGIAASASLTLVVGAAVGITSSRPPAHTAVADRPAIVAPPPSAVPTVDASPAALAPSTPVATTPTPAPVTPPQAAPPAPVSTAPRPVTLGPVTFTPIPLPPPPTAQATPAPPAASPTPCFLLIVC